MLYIVHVHFIWIYTVIQNYVYYEFYSCLVDGGIIVALRAVLFIVWPSSRVIGIIYFMHDVYVL